MTLLGQHEYVEHSPFLFVPMDPRANLHLYGDYVYQSNHPRSVDDASASWGMYSPTYAHSTISVAQGKEHLHSATSALMSLQSEPSYTPDQYDHIRPDDRARDECRVQESWSETPNQATPALLPFDSQPHPNAPFGGSGNYLQGAHRWASGTSSPSTPTPGSVPDSSQPASYLSASGPPNPTGNYPTLIPHASQPHTQSAATGSQFLRLHSPPFSSTLSPPSSRPQSNTAMSTSQPLNPRRRSSTSNSTSSSATITGSSLGLNLTEPKAYHGTDIKLAKSRIAVNLASEAASSSTLREKPKLLTKDQKKKNHIHSEQKRRATIRHGYALLCEEVPSLRLAIAAAEADDAEQAMDGEGRRRRRSRGRASTTDGERVDGRAGPRSESVVLVKTIDHLKHLLATRQELVSRVQELRAGDPGGDSPWERVWDGGTGLAPEGGVDEYGEDDGEGESDEADGQ